MQDLFAHIVDIGIDSSAQDPWRNYIVIYRAQVRFPFDATVGVRPDDRQQQVAVAVFVVSVNKPEIVIGVVCGGGAVVLASDLGPSSLDSGGACQVDMMHVAQVEAFISTEN